jgi:hypothetical protein
MRLLPIVGSGFDVGHGLTVHRQEEE